VQSTREKFENDVLTAKTQQTFSVLTTPEKHQRLPALEESECMFSAFSCLKSSFEKLRFRSGLAWTVGNRINKSFFSNLSMICTLFLVICHLNRPFSYSRYWTGTSMQVRLMQGVFSNANDIDLFLMIFARMSLHCKLVPVQQYFTTCLDYCLLNLPFKDVRANCFCASFCARNFTRHVMHERAR